MRKKKIVFTLLLIASATFVTIIVSNSGQNTIDRTTKTKIYPRILRRMIKEKDKLKLTQKQKSQIEALIWKCENYGR